MPISTSICEGSVGPFDLRGREGPPLENTLTREPDLYDHLLWQLHLTELASQREIAELIIGNLDPEGFLVATLEEIREMGRRSWRMRSTRRTRCERLSVWCRVSIHLGSPVRIFKRACSISWMLSASRKTL